MGITGSGIPAAAVMIQTAVVVMMPFPFCFKGDPPDLGRDINNRDFTLEDAGDPLFIKHIGGQKELCAHGKTQFPGAGSVVMRGTSRRKHGTDPDTIASHC